MRMDRFVDLARREARKSEMRMKHGAVVVCTRGRNRGQVVASSFNAFTRLEKGAILSKGKEETVVSRRATRATRLLAFGEFKAS